jgi:ribosomal protein L10
MDKKDEKRSVDFDISKMYPSKLIFDYSEFDSKRLSELASNTNDARELQIISNELIQRAMYHYQKNENDFKVYCKMIDIQVVEDKEEIITLKVLDNTCVVFKENY